MLIHLNWHWGTSTLVLLINWCILASAYIRLTQINNNEVQKLTLFSPHTCIPSSCHWSCHWSSYSSLMLTWTLCPVLVSVLVFILLCLLLVSVLSFYFIQTSIVLCWRTHCQKLSCHCTRSITKWVTRGWESGGPSLRCPIHTTPTLF